MELRRREAGWHALGLNLPCYDGGNREASRPGCMYCACPTIYEGYRQNREGQDVMLARLQAV